MAQYSFIISLFLFAALPFTHAATRPKALVAPITKDTTKLQYITQIAQRTPLKQEKLVIDLNGDFIWVQCDRGAYKSSTYKPVRCGSALCHAAESISCVTECYSPPSPGCNNNTCDTFPENSIIKLSTGGELTTDVVALSSTDGRNPGEQVTVPHYPFTCTAGFLLEGLAEGVSGMAGLGRGLIAMPAQLAAAFSFPRQFAICLPGGGTGALFFGPGPYVFLPGVDASQGLAYVPLLRNHKSQFLKNSYFIDVRGIQIDDVPVSFDLKLLKIDSEGKGGIMISTVVNYTTMATPICKALSDAFVKAAAARGIAKVNGVGGFGTCFSAKNVSSTRLGPGVPSIELVLPTSGRPWRIFGANSMVSVSDDELCLGFLDGGESPASAIVIGTFQFENNLLQFDLARSRLGISEILFGRQTTCSNFNFTSSV